ncbi:MAG: Lsr2 family protein [Microbacteriaceae bacterium]|nr:Lsr2 family protein [Microbacteriaceae bacterium]
MAIKTVLIDDFDGSPLAGGSTTTFSLNGAAYEIDLSAENAEKLKEALAPFIRAGRRVAAGSAPRAASTRPAARRSTRSNGSNDLTAIREWAKANGHVVGERGRIPAPVREAYEAASA